MLCETWHKQDPQMDEDLQMKLAQIDLEYCLARTTTAEVAVRDGEVVGAVLGRIDAQETRKGINQHHRSVMKIMGPLFFNKSAHQALKNMLNAEKADRQMIKQAKKDGHAYDGEIVLFIVREDMRGQGIGPASVRLDAQEFKVNNVEHYFLYTDTDCDSPLSTRIAAGASHGDAHGTPHAEGGHRGAIRKLITSTTICMAAESTTRRHQPMRVSTARPVTN